MRCRQLVVRRSAGLVECGGRASERYAVPSWLNSTGAILMCPGCLRAAQARLTALP